MDIDTEHSSRLFDCLQFPIFHVIVEILCYDRTVCNGERNHRGIRSPGCIVEKEALLSPLQVAVALQAKMAADQSKYAILTMTGEK